MWCAFQYFREWHVAFIPLEYQHAALFQDSEAFGESTAQVVAPCFAVQPSVGLRHVAISAKEKMWWIEYDKLKGFVWIVHFSKVVYTVR